MNRFLLALYSHSYSYLLFGDKSLLQIFYPAYEAALKYLKRGPWYIEANMDNEALIWPIFNSLQAFWPGLQVLSKNTKQGITWGKKKSSL